MRTESGCVREIREQEDVGAQQRCGGRFPTSPARAVVQGVRCGGRSHWGCTEHRPPSTTLVGPRDPRPESHAPAPPGLRFCASVPPVVLATGSLLSNQPCYHPAWSLAVSLGNSVCWFPRLPSPTSGSSPWEGQGRGRRGWLGDACREGASLCDGIGFSQSPPWAWKGRDSFPMCTESL